MTKVDLQRCLLHGAHKGKTPRPTKVQIEGQSLPVQKPSSWVVVGPLGKIMMPIMNVLRSQDNHVLRRYTCTHFS